MSVPREMGHCVSFGLTLSHLSCSRPLSAGFSLMRRGTLAVRVAETFRGPFSTKLSFLRLPITDGELVRQVVLGIYSTLLWRISVPTHHVFGEFILYNSPTGSVQIEFTVIGWYGLSVLSRRLALRDFVVASIDKMTHVKPK